MALQFQPTNAHVKHVTCWTDRIPADYHYKCTRETNIRLIESHASNAQVHVLLVPSWFYSRPQFCLSVPEVTFFDYPRKFLLYFSLI